MNKKYFLVDGRTVDYETLAGELGITVCALHVAASKYRDRSMQEIADMYRDGRIRSRVHGAHCVHGRWLTVAEAAAELGLAPGTLQGYRYKWGATLEAAVDRVLQAREHPWKRRGRAPARHRVRGKLMTVNEASEAFGIRPGTLRLMIRYHRCSLEEAVTRCEEARKKRAARRIISILTEKER